MRSDPPYQTVHGVGCSYAGQHTGICSSDLVLAEVHGVEGVITAVAIGADDQVYAKFSGSQPLCQESIYLRVEWTEVSRRGRLRGGAVQYPEQVAIAEVAEARRRHELLWRHGLDMLGDRALVPLDHHVRCLSYDESAKAGRDTPARRDVRQQEGVGERVSDDILPERFLRHLPHRIEELARLPLSLPD